VVRNRRIPLVAPLANSNVILAMCFASAELTDGLPASWARQSKNGAGSSSHLSRVQSTGSTSAR
jgi:hypothetical protein